MGGGCELVDGAGNWRVHVHNACFVKIKLHAVLAGVLLESGEHLLKYDCRFRK